MNSQEIFDLLNKKLYKVYTNIETDTCVVCHECYINNNKPIVILICGHIYHYKCFPNIENKCYICKQ